MTEVGAVLLIIGEGLQVAASGSDPKTATWLSLSGRLLQAIGAAAIAYRVSKKVGGNGKA